MRFDKTAGPCTPIRPSRERQKARLLEMQVTIDRLHQELAQRQGVQGRNQRLEEQHCRLQAQVGAPVH